MKKLYHSILLYCKGYRLRKICGQWRWVKLSVSKYVLTLED